MTTREQIISHLLHCSNAEAGRINDRLQQCNVRVIRTNGEIEISFAIRTRLQLVSALTDDTSIESVEYQFNGKWTRIA